VAAATVFCGMPQNSKKQTITQRIQRDGGLDPKKSLAKSIISFETIDV